jgi:hypothetical protein
MIGRIDRDAHRGDPEDPRRRRRRPRPEQDQADEVGYAVDERDGDDDPGLHIDVTA